VKHNRHIAKQVDDWIRLEAEYSGVYAHQLTDEIKKCQTDTELKNLILNCILDKYMFFYSKSNKPHPITKAMLELLDTQDFHFHTPSPRNNLLEQSIDHLVKGSGLFPTLFKIESIWGEEAIEEFMEFLFTKYYEEFISTQDHNGWLNKYKNFYLRDGKPWQEGVN